MHSNDITDNLYLDSQCECTHLHVHEHVCEHLPLSFLTNAVPLSTAISIYPYLDTLFQCFVVDAPVPFCLHKLHLRENKHIIMCLLYLYLY